MRTWKAPAVGDEIDSRCRRCQDETIHRVVAMVEGAVHLVICTRCGSQHRYRPALQPRRRPRPMPSKRQARVLLKTSPPSHSQAAPLPQWLQLKKEAANTPPVAYRQSDRYRQGQALLHPTFGLGFVLRELGADKIEVVFEHRVRVLVAGRSAV